MGKRLAHIDLLKGIGIILVLLGHLSINGIMHMLIYSFHIPLFFFCSGFFFKSRPILENLRKDMKTIIRPYIFFAFVLIITLILIPMHQTGVYMAVKSLYINPFDSQCYALYHTIWFLICMFFVREIFNLLCKAFKYPEFIGLGGYLLALVFRLCNIKIPFFIDTAVGMMFFYSMGDLFKNSKYMQMKLGPFLMFVILIVYAILACYLSPDVNVRDNVYPWYICLSATIPILSLYYLSYNISTYNNKLVKFIELCGQKSLFIFALHGPIFELAFPIMGHCGINDFLQTIILMSVSIPICLFAEKVLTRYAPFLIGKK